MGIVKQKTNYWGLFDSLTLSLSLSFYRSPSLQFSRSYCCWLVLLLFLCYNISIRNHTRDHNTMSPSINRHKQRSVVAPSCRVGRMPSNHRNRYKWNHCIQHSTNENNNNNQTKKNPNFFWWISCFYYYCCCCWSIAAKCIKYIFCSIQLNAYNKANTCNIHNQPTTTKKTLISFCRLKIAMLIISLLLLSVSLCLSECLFERPAW